MTDQKHTKELKKINNNRGLNSMQAYLATYNLCDIVIKDLAEVTKQRDELRDMLLAFFNEAENGFPENYFSRHLLDAGEKLLTKTKGDV